MLAAGFHLGESNRNPFVLSDAADGEWWSCPNGAEADEAGRAADHDSLGAGSAEDGDKDGVAADGDDDDVKLEAAIKLSLAPAGIALHPVHPTVADPAQAVRGAARPLRYRVRRTDSP